MSDELDTLAKKVQTSAAQKMAESLHQAAPVEQSREDELINLQYKLRAAVERADEISSAGEAAISDAYIKLQSYVSNKLPMIIKDSIETTAKMHINQSVDNLLLPLKEEIDGLSRDVEDCRVKLRKMSWSWRLFVGQVGTGLTFAMIGGVIVYFGLIGDMRRYANWGKKVEKTVNTYNQKARDVLLQDFGKP